MHFLECSKTILVIPNPVLTNKASVDINFLQGVLFSIFLNLGTIKQLKLMKN